MKLSRSTLVGLLIVKSVIEAVVVIVVAVAFYLTTTNPSLRGSLDHADPQTISGWAVDRGNAGRRVEVQLFIDNKFVEQRLASDFRPDIHEARNAVDVWHGFVFHTPALSPGEHEARVYALNPSTASPRRTLQIIGKSLRFNVSSQSTTNIHSTGQN
jgi:hypothetical protein